MTDNITPAIGHNRGPAFDSEELERAASRAKSFQDRVSKWIAIKRIEDDETAAGMADFMQAAKHLVDEIEAIRKAQKQPHLDGSRAVDAAFKPLVDGIERARKQAKIIQADWLRRKRSDEDARRRQEARKAREAERAAADAAEAANARGDYVAQEEAERAREAAAADAAAAAAAPVKAQARGAGRAVSLRTRTKARLTNPRIGVLQFKDHPDVIALVEKLAAAKFRAGEEVPGFEKTEEEYAA